MPFKQRDKSFNNRHSYEHRGTEVDGEDITNQSDEKDSFKGESMQSFGYPTYEHKELNSDSISEILDVECGEPFTSQHLRIDFNPLEGVDDNEYILKKCISFWKLVEENPILQCLKVLPQKPILDTESLESSSLERLSSAMEEEPLKPLEIIEKQGRIMSDIFATKFKRSYCEEGSGDFISDTSRTSKAGIAKSHEVSAKSKTEIIYGAMRSRTQDSNELKKLESFSKAREKQMAEKQQKEASKLCQELEHWDIGNLKSMEPPGHPPLPSYSVLQKNFKGHGMVLYGGWALETDSNETYINV